MMSSLTSMKNLLVCLCLLIAISSCNSESHKAEVTSSVEIKGPFIHSVYIWFKPGVTQGQKDAMAEASMKLAEINGVLAVYDGGPAATDRPIVERSYDYALIVHMKDLATHDAYQVDPIHLNLLKTYSDLWERVMVTDVE